MCKSGSRVANASEGGQDREDEEEDVEVAAEDEDEDDKVTFPPFLRWLVRSITLIRNYSRERTGERKESISGTGNGLMPGNDAEDIPIERLRG